MASSADSLGSAPEPSVREAAARVTELQENLYFHKAVLASLLDGPASPEKKDEIQTTEAEIKKLCKQVLEARHVQNQASKKKKTKPDSMNGTNGIDFFGGWHHPSGYSTPSSMSTPSNSSSGLGPRGQPSNATRKRTFSTHLDSTQQSPPDAKSRRTTPSPLHSAFATPSSGSGFGDVDVIDLTGDNDEYTALQRAQEEAFRQSKEAIERDAAFARRLQEGGELDSPPWPSPALGSSDHTYFDRILGRTNQNNSSSGNSTSAGLYTRPSQGNRYNGPAWPDSQSSQYRTKTEPGLSTTLSPGSNAKLSVRGGRSESQPQLKPEPQASPSRVSTSQSLSNQYKILGSFDATGDDSDDEIEILDGPPGQPYGLYNGYGSSSTSLNRYSTPQLPAPPARPIGFGRNSSFNMALGVPASELARQAALARQEPDQSTAGFGAYAGNNTSGFGQGFSSPSQWTTPGLPRPGTLNGGSYDPLNAWNLNGASGSQATSGQGNDYLNDIIQRTNNYDYNNMVDGFGNPLPDHLRQWVDDVVNDPRKNAEEIQNLLSNIRPDMEIPVEEREGTPEALRYSLYPHQQLALKWMKDMEDGTNKGGILADDMGLGKTISTLSLMVCRPSPNRNVKTNLIIGPVSLIKQWESEIKKKLKPNHSLSVFLLHGRKSTYESLRVYDVVLTTYGMVASEWKRYDKYKLSHPGADYDNDAELARKCPLLHGKSKWYRIILDEAQCIKNKDTQSARGAHDLQSTYRWCLTGTPMMNGVQELYSLIRFLRIRPFTDHKNFTKEFGSLTAKSARSSEYQRSSAMQRLRVLLKSVMLRRMKNSELDGKPILTLPPKTEEVVHVVFSEDEDKFYRDLESTSQVQFNKYLRAGTIGKNYSNILVLLLRLRQACCHPHLNLDFESVADGVHEASLEDLKALAQSLDENVVSRIKAIEAFECPICYDAAVNPSLVIPCGHDTCSGCLQQLTDNTAQNNLRNGQEDDGAAKCPQCRGPIDPKRVIDYHTFKLVHMPEKVAEEGLDGLKNVDSDDSEGSTTDTDDDETSSEPDDSNDADADGNLKGFVVPDDETSDDDFDAPQDLKKKTTGNSKVKSKKSKKNKGKKVEDVKPHMLKTLRQEAGKNKESRRKYMHYLKNNWETSAKVTKACEILEGLRETEEKTIIFSVWTGLLDLLEIPIKYDLGLKYCRYDGGMSTAHRNQAAQSFMEDPRVKVMLVSLKAGNAGLNLTAASQVIIMDPFWNPYIEMQAVDRAHRIGQQKPVKVHRILVGKTVEDRIVELQERKRQLVDAALDEGESKNLGRLTHQELRYLFGVNR